MDPLSSTYVLWAVALGGLSAVSLPLGSAAGLRLRPSAGVTALLAAFGAGALIAALALELVAPAAFALHGAGAHAGDAVAAFVALLVGALLGGVLFVVLDRALAERGGFLRKISTSIAWYSRREHERSQGWLKDLCAIPLLRALPAARAGELVRDVRPRVFSDGEDLFREGDPSNTLFFVRRGSVALTRGTEALEPLGPGGILGDLSLLTDSPYAVGARAQGTVETLALRREDRRLRRGDTYEPPLRYEQNQQAQTRRISSARPVAWVSASAPDLPAEAASDPSPEKARPWTPVLRQSSLLARSDS